jgi:exopolyphosphatase/guanosine-5'-triphosphate,3'-diphosphate pyrophosphatase
MTAPSDPFNSLSYSRPIIVKVSSRMPEPALLAAIDLGSNSFRLLIARTSGNGAAPAVRAIDSVKRSVRLAAGLDSDRRLDADSRMRGLEALSVFSDRLRAFAPQSVRAVATNTLRVAQNAADFLADAQAVLGYPIEVISGHEEARLIWIGASHALGDGRRRLVIDIGGGSTECILGIQDDPLMLDSIDIGCVSSTLAYFDRSTIDERGFDRALRQLKQQFAPVARRARTLGWEHAVGTSGTAKALTQLARDVLGSPNLDRLALEQLRRALLSTPIDASPVFSQIKPDRRAVIAGGLAVMTAVFDEFGLDAMDYCEAALRDGILIELWSELAGSDIREQTVARLERRYQLDPARGRRLAETAWALFDQAARAVREERLERRALLGWAARLADAGKIIAEEAHHRHAAYVLRHADMPGFNVALQGTLSALVLSQTGGLRKLRGLVSGELGWLSVLSLRLAIMLERHSAGDTAVPPLPALFFKQGAARIEIDRHWLNDHPQARQDLIDEAARWMEQRLLAQFDIREL